MNWPSYGRLNLNVQKGQKRKKKTPSTSGDWRVERVFDDFLRRNKIIDTLSTLTPRVFAVDEFAPGSHRLTYRLLFFSVDRLKNKSLYVRQCEPGANSMMVRWWQYFLDAFLFCRNVMSVTMPAKILPPPLAGKVNSSIYVGSLMSSRRKQKARSGARKSSRFWCQSLDHDQNTVFSMVFSKSLKFSKGSTIEDASD